ncbi:NADH-ubiquinone oxidoreductase complex I, 21 kDa subunit-domain-containing protein [Mycena floridula]|nr:NADH-ubiquinone oxidoreductase complex I, 21 kDa subunit-domain-containing protein [Mycena floridula]
MPEKVLTTSFPLIDVDPHASRVVRYMRPSDVGWWAGSTVGFPAAYLAWHIADPSAGIATAMRPALRVCGILGFAGGFLLAYQRSSLRFMGWSENAREYQKDLEELSQRAREGKTLYGESVQPEWIQGAAYRNSVFSQLKFAAFPNFNLVNHPHHGTDPAKYGVKPKENKEQNPEQESQN